MSNDMGNSGGYSSMISGKIYILQESLFMASKWFLKKNKLLGNIFKLLFTT